jgi:hypothetical protein
MEPTRALLISALSRLMADRGVGILPETIHQLVINPDRILRSAELEHTTFVVKR